MESQTSTPSETVPQRLHLFPAGLSLVCPGLGQLVQGRPVFLCHVITWVLVVVTWIPFFPVLWRVWINDLDYVVALLLLFGWIFLLPIMLVLFAVLDAAIWEKGKPSPFKKHFIILIALLIPLSLFLATLVDILDGGRTMQCHHHLKGLALAFWNYHEEHGSFPPAYTIDENGQPLHSWRVLLLPFICDEKLDTMELYEKIRLDEPWDSEYNRQFHEVQIQWYQCPASGRNTAFPSSRLRDVIVNSRDLHRMANCDYSVVIGDETVFPGSKTVSGREITDGTSQTILVVERMIPVNWMDPNNEIRFDVAKEGINRHLFGIGGRHADGWTLATFVDGATKIFPPTTDIRPLLTKSAGD